MHRHKAAKVPRLPERERATSAQAPPMKYESATNRRLHDPSRAQELAVDAAHHVRATVSDASADASAYRVVLGLGPGRSGTKSLTELLAAQAGCVHAEHEMVVQRRYRRDESGRVDPCSAFVQQNKKKGSWGSDRRLEWDAPRLVRGATPLTEEEEATLRVLRLLEQREAIDEWVRRDEQSGGDKPRKLGARGWRRHNSSGEEEDGVIAGMNDVPVVAAVSSAGLAYVHEYIALDPTIRIVVLMRLREEVVESFLKKSKGGRNHWQRHERRRRRSPDDEQPTKVAEYVQPDKTWDGAFPNMSAEECWQFNGGINKDGTVIPDKASAIRAYWELYNKIALELVHQYPSNVRVFDMYGALNDASVQDDLLRFCGFNEPVLLTSSEVHLNKYA